MKPRSTKPLLSFALAAAITGTILGVAPMPAMADAPSVEKIFENCVKAVGGQEAVDKIKTLHIESTMSMMGMQIDLDQAWSRDGGRIMTATMPQGQMTMGTDGKTAWMKSQMGYMLAPPDQARDLESQAGMFMFMTDPKSFAKKDLGELSVVGEAEFEGKKCYKLKFTKKDSGDGHVYFDSETGLPVGFEEYEDKDAGEDGGRNTMILSDWKEVDGVKFFHLVTMRGSQGPGSPPMEGEMKVSKIEVNKLADDHFELPEQVKAMVKDQPKEGDPVEEIKLDDLTPEAQKEAAQMLKGITGQPGTNMIKQVLPAMEMSVSQGQLPPDQMLKMKYIVQELKKELKTRGG